MALFSPGQEEREMLASDPAALRDPERLAALHASGLLDTPPEEAFDRLARLAARVVGAPIALVSLLDDRRQFFKSQIGSSLFRVGS
jgi:hypothetical protein